MNGPDVDRLEVYAQRSGGGGDEMVWRRDGDQGSEWMMAQIHVTGDFTVSDCLLSMLLCYSLLLLVLFESVIRTEFTTTDNYGQMLYGCKDFFFKNTNILRKNHIDIMERHKNAMLWLAVSYM